MHIKNHLVDYYKIGNTQKCMKKIHEYKNMRKKTRIKIHEKKCMEQKSTKKIHEIETHEKF